LSDPAPAPLLTIPQVLLILALDLRGRRVQGSKNGTLPRAHGCHGLATRHRHTDRHIACTLP